MTDTLAARIPSRVEQKLAEYCARQGITRTEALVRALDAYLNAQSVGPNAYALAVDLIAEHGAARLQSADVRELARAAFRGPRAR